MIFILIALISFKTALFCDFNIDLIKPKLEKEIEKSIKAWDVPGIGIAIVHKDKIVYENYYGVEKKGTNKKYSKNTLQGIHSSTKAFTSVILMMLVKEGRISLEDKVIKYIPDFKLNNEELTNNFRIIDILIHNSGIPNFALDSVWALGFSSAEMLNKINLISPENKKGEKYGYQNIFYGVIGMIIEKITGKPYHQVLKEKLLMPLNMNDSTADEDYVKKLQSNSIISKVKNFFSKNKLSVSFPHTNDWNKIDKKFQSTPFDHYHHIFEFPSTSGVHTTLKDLCKFSMFFIKNGAPILAKKHFNDLVTERINVPLKESTQQFPKFRFKSLKYCFGLFSGKYGENMEKTYIISGGTSGARSLIGILPDKNIAIVIISNLGGQSINKCPEEIQYAFYDMVLNINYFNYRNHIYKKSKKFYEKMYKNLNKDRLISPNSHKNLHYYEGIYENKLYGKIHIKKLNDILNIRHEKKYSWEVSHWNKDIFTTKSSKVTPHLSAAIPAIHQFFNFSKSGKAENLWINIFSEGDDGIFNRVSD